ncbi:MAG: hypothetical protein IPL88_06775 [Rhizobiales bacterium]|nr:hypothetical protein [Hyphomicrobiales bacterium]
MRRASPAPSALWPAGRAARRDSRPDYAAAPAGAALTPLQAGVAQIAEISRNIANAMAVLVGSHAALTAPAGSALHAGYALAAPAFDLNFALNRLADDRARAEAVRKIATVLAKAIAYMNDATNFLYAPPALLTRHRVAAGAYAYFLSSDRKVYFADKYLDLRPAGRRRATTDDAARSPGRPRARLVGRRCLAPAERLNNADNYVWFVDYCQPPFGRKQPKP